MSKQSGRFQIFVAFSEYLNFKCKLNDPTSSFINQSNIDTWVLVSCFLKRFLICWVYEFDQICQMIFSKVNFIRKNSNPCNDRSVLMYIIGYWVYRTKTLVLGESIKVIFPWKSNGRRRNNFLLRCSDTLPLGHFFCFSSILSLIA